MNSTRSWPAACAVVLCDASMAWPKTSRARPCGTRARLSGGGGVARERADAVVPGPRRQMFVSELIQRISTAANAVEFVRAHE